MPVHNTNSAEDAAAFALIDDAIYIDDADWVDGTSKHALVGGLYQSTAQTVTDGDVAPLEVDVNGGLILGTGTKAIGKLAANSGVDIGDVNIPALDGSLRTFTRVKIDNAALMTLLNPGAGKIAVLHAIHIVAAAAATVTFAYDDDGAGTNAVALTGAMSLAQNGVLDIDFEANAEGCLQGIATKFLTMTPSAAVDGYAVVSIVT